MASISVWLMKKDLQLRGENVSDKTKKKQETKINRPTKEFSIGDIS